MRLAAFRKRLIKNQKREEKLNEEERFYIFLFELVAPDWSDYTAIWQYRRCSCRVKGS
jgi:hypothetical protein